MKGGAETFYFKTARLLEEHGHESCYFSMRHPDNLPCDTEKYFMPHLDLNTSHSFREQIRISGRILYSLEARRRLSELLERNEIDIAHLHNIYHNISPSILHELKKRNIPVVLTVHDPKLACGSHNMYTYVNEDGHKVCRICEACKGRKFYMPVLKRCVKESYAKSVLIAIENYLHHSILDIYRHVDVFISPSRFFISKFSEMGFDKEMTHLPYFIDTERVQELNKSVDGIDREQEMSVIFFGRLSLEKGLFTLLKAAKKMMHHNSRLMIKIVGDGPIRNELLERARSDGLKNVIFLGYMNHDNLYREVRKSIAAVLPSEWYDNYPMSIIETFAIGVPVIASRIGGIPEMVKDHETGLTFEPWNADDLCKKMSYFEAHIDEAKSWGEHGKQFVEHNLNAQDHYEKLMSIYEYAIEKSRTIQRHS